MIPTGNNKRKDNSRKVLQSQKLMTVAPPVAVVPGQRTSRRYDISFMRSLPTKHWMWIYLVTAAGEASSSVDMERRHEDTKLRYKCSESFNFHTILEACSIGIIWPRSSCTPEIIIIWVNSKSNCFYPYEADYIACTRYAKTPFN
ncbi:hypothetical protein CBL_00166 [Carabus blaptoides fortunei]